MVDETKSVRPFHPLFAKGEITPIVNWSQWLELWDKAKTMQELESLLHFGFDVCMEKMSYAEKEYNNADRVIFYLSIADGWNNYFSFRRYDGEDDHYYVFGYDARLRPEVISNQKIRQYLAKKAFDVLCVRFFEKAHFDATGVHGMIFPAIKNFFSVRHTEYDVADKLVIKNLSQRSERRSHQEESAVRFLFSLAYFIIRWKKPDPTSWHSDEQKLSEEKQNNEQQAYINPVKPWAIKILCGLERLDQLTKQEIIALDEPCLSTLREIALSNKLLPSQYPVRTGRVVSTIDEACYVESKSAWLLKQRELLIKEKMRLEDIATAEEEKQEAERKLQELQQ